MGEVPPNMATVRWHVVRMCVGAASCAGMNSGYHCENGWTYFAVILFTPCPAIPSPHALCRYADESGTTLEGPDGQTNVAIAEYIGSGDLVGLEELHIFFEIAWFDKGSWAWGQYLAEWGTRGIFQVGTQQTRQRSGPVGRPRKMMTYLAT